MMNVKKIIPVIIIASISFNTLVILGQTSIHFDSVRWPFTDLGPAVIQDSGLGRAPALESPFGIIGDLPGLYAFYDGNPLQNANIAYSQGVFDMGAIILAILFCIIPISFVLILGRRSYGVSKTR